MSHVREPVERRSGRGERHGHHQAGLAALPLQGGGLGLLPGAGSRGGKRFRIVCAHHVRERGPVAD
jgi:hypothetical protein